MGLEDGRGKYMKEQHKKNRMAIVEWEQNNTGSMRDCARDTGISYACVRSHFAEMAACKGVDE